MRAVIFDLDGTLIHSAPDLHAAANRMLADLNRAPLTIEEVTGFVGNGVPKLVERCLDASGGPDPRGLEIFSAHYSAAPADLTRPYPGVVDMLETLMADGLSLGICTNKPAAPAHAILEILGLDHLFGALTGGDTLAVRKPDPATLRRCAEDLGAPVDRVVYVGDSETDAATAHNAGVPFALFTGGYRKTPVAELAPDFAFDEFPVLTPWLRDQS